MTREDYLALAIQAVRHVKANVDYRALNTPGGWIRRPLEVPQKFAARLASNRQVARFLAAHPGPRNMRVYIDELDRLARETGTGNCSDLTAVAFKHLEANQVAPIEYFGVERPGWGHAFVVLNRDPGIPLSDFARWSASAVLCDPQYDRAEIAGFLAYRYPHALPFKAADVWYRSE